MAEKGYPGKLDILATIIFVLVSLFALGLSATGVINPLVAGLILMTLTILMLAGLYMTKKGIMPSGWLSFWYLFVIAVTLIMFGAIQRGWIPLFVPATSYDVAIALTLFTVTLLVLALSIPVVFLIYYYYYKKPTK